MDMNDLLSGLADSQKNGSNKSCNCNNDGGGCNNGGGLGGGSGIWIIVLLLLFCSQGQGQDNGTVCGCEPKHCKELCRCGGSSNNGLFGLGGLGSGCGGGSGIWIIVLILLLVCSGNGRNNKGCTNNIINLDSCDED
ncbi:hypothetical protein KPL37_16400 [Clostridium frigoris]|uniref:Chorion class high-cysteine HCB protein 13 n=1 Tax=Clostridium frigoris TaxID=205327 RepID=A0ABS6BXF9_9CLOT|nr:hypothetical protein [Clostridium frigoris]MBU3161293.1 hypothetical protein [Clostridium frigoris]